jgi:methionyl-tRNA synthetase
MPEELISQISIEDFAKIQMRVGQVLEAEKIENSRKLVKLKVDIGTEVRQVVAGIAEAYEPESLINKKVVIVANLKPARLMGVESNGMIVAASIDGKPVLATFAEEVPNGALLK